MTTHDLLTLPGEKQEALNPRFNAGLRTYLLGLYAVMSVASLISGAAAFSAARWTPFFEKVYRMQGDSITGINSLGWLVILAPVGMALLIGNRVKKFDLITASVALGVFAIIIGLSLATLVIHYTGASVATIFVLTATAFGVMSFYGYKTRRDLGGVGSMLIMTAISFALSAIVNLALQNSMLQFALSALGGLIFTGLTAFNIQRLREIYNEFGEKSGHRTVSTLGALTLYMALITIFASFARLLGERN